MNSLYELENYRKMLDDVNNGFKNLKTKSINDSLDDYTLSEFKNFFIKYPERLQDIIVELRKEKINKLLDK
jgi:hypothetical protein